MQTAVPQGSRHISLRQPYHILTKALVLLLTQVVAGTECVQDRTSYAFSSSIAFSAFVSVTTPTIAAAVAPHSLSLHVHYYFIDACFPVKQLVIG